jgi:hypothetical protein
MWVFVRTVQVRWKNPRAVRVPRGPAIAVAGHCMSLLTMLPRSLRQKLIRSRMGFVDTDIEGFEVTLAEGEDDTFAAARSVHDSYVERGIMSPHPSGLRVTPHVVLPTTRIFVAKLAGRVIGTISLVIDSPMGLPMDAVYGDELGSLRTPPTRIAEVGALAIAREHRRTGLVFLLNRIMFECAARLGIDRLVIAVHPDAEDLYAATMLFERFAGERCYPGLNRSARAVALTLDLTTAEQQLARAFGGLGPCNANTHHLYFVRPCPQIDLPTCLTDRSAREQRLDACAALVRARRDVFRSLPSHQLAHLRKVLPNVLWSAPSQPEFAVQSLAALAPAAA